jgi:hypothetical protein
MEYGLNENIPLSEKFSYPVDLTRKDLLCHRSERIERYRPHIMRRMLIEWKETNKERRK